ncbi:MAG TPA: lipoprotein [Ramlibacter sp.]|nr:lipoprotein [Ramlibacter sp.]
MSGEHQILVSAPARRRLLALAALAGSCLLAACGQKGPLVLPTGEAAEGRRTLPQTLVPITVVPPQSGAPAPVQEAPPLTPGPGNASPTRQP